ncbi:MAG TPA: SHOCT domain-containing protein [Gaiellaceae bacterium]
MNPTPPFQGRGFGYGPGLRVHEQLGNTPLEWATFALVLLIALTLGALIVARVAGGGRRRHFGHRMRMRGRPDPLEVLRIRFASGQISREEYLQATSDLAADAPTQPSG